MEQGQRVSKVGLSVAVIVFLVGISPLLFICYLWVSCNQSIKKAERERAIRQAAAIPSPTSIPRPSPTPEIPLSALVKFDQEKIIISNLDGSPWTNCTIRLNAEGFGSGYKTSILFFPAKSDIAIAYADLAKPDGTRFNIQQTKPLVIYISATVNSARRHYGGRF